MADELPTLILLAAGRSSRMGRAKGLLPLGGKPWIEHQIAPYRAAGGKRVIVVLGEDRADYLPVLGSLIPPPRVVVNDRTELGPFRSLQLAIQALSPGEHAFVQPVDVPLAGADVLWRLENALEDASACQPRCSGRGGHPVLLAENFAKELAALPLDHPEARLDAQLRKLSSTRLTRVDVDDERVLMNLNDPEAWEAFRSKWWPSGTP